MFFSIYWERPYLSVIKVLCIGGLFPTWAPGSHLIRDDPVRPLFMFRYIVLCGDALERLPNKLTSLGLNLDISIRKEVAKKKLKHSLNKHFITPNHMTCDFSARNANAGNFLFGQVNYVQLSPAPHMAPATSLRKYMLTYINARRTIHISSRDSAIRQSA